MLLHRGIKTEQTGRQLFRAKTYDENQILNITATQTGFPHLNCISGRRTHDPTPQRRFFVFCARIQPSVFVIYTLCISYLGGVCVCSENHTLVKLSHPADICKMSNGTFKWKKVRRKTFLITSKLEFCFLCAQLWPLFPMAFTFPFSFFSFPLSLFLFPFFPLSFLSFPLLLFFSNSLNYNEPLSLCLNYKWGNFPTGKRLSVATLFIKIWFQQDAGKKSKDFKCSHIWLQNV